MPPEGFLPTQWDCDDWIVSAKRAGMQYAVLVCKHHDGFANWPSDFFTYTVAQTPWKGARVISFKSSPTPAAATG
ncbi:MAG: hypothetical protein HN919_15960 [Verrucomicrobia bacterium]|jgi:alpha-L-fucosidase|nr:hypothetical protein [Verrucomicrobiota bacterium]MBT7067794.1 hypothetical protein [Verrucomicrobiota bacterium]MBT7701037.1 hypothetical protein [Verrucomicrobiota bacterium]